MLSINHSECIKKRIESDFSVCKTMPARFYQVITLIIATNDNKLLFPFNISCFPLAKSFMMKFDIFSQSFK